MLNYNSRAGDLLLAQGDGLAGPARRSFVDTLSCLQRSETLRQTLRQHLGQRSLSELQFGILLLMRASGQEPLTMTELAEGLAVSKPAISDALLRMIAAHWVKPEAHQRDRRARRVRLTPGGAEVADQGVADCLRLWSEPYPNEVRRALPGEEEKGRALAPAPEAISRAASESRPGREGPRAGGAPADDRGST